ncbi:unnamed protein product [Notodromas monacha]|uniref:Vacuolar protein sorting-associated protein 26C n=1 Tax=Notodromas monacha TaxID=399045 RepID=A0A7R9BJP8_9CRUS|nr:unnamed protein product [Notodromas monacha]CAG0915933.1 unnamed protein product [Notodromas monacha]
MNLLLFFFIACIISKLHRVFFCFLPAYFRSGLESKMAASVDVRLKRSSKIYHQGEVMTGLLVLSCKSDFRHEGITLFLDGTVNLQLSSKTFGLFEAFYNSVKPITLMSYQTDVAKPGRIPAGVVEIPFEFHVVPNGASKKLYETYHGVFVNVQYSVRCEMKRGMLSKDLQKSIEFIVQYRDQEADRAVLKPLAFTVTPESVRNMKDRDRMPNFHIKGRLDSTVCAITQPFTGELTIERCDIQIKSIEVQLVRVETCGCAEGYAKEATEVQNIRIGEGNVMRGISIPIHMIFPRLFSCPTLAAPNFKVEFEVNLVILLKDDHVITETFPIRITRS